MLFLKIYIVIFLLLAMTIFAYVEADIHLHKKLMVIFMHILRVEMLLFLISASCVLGEIFIKIFF